MNSCRADYFLLLLVYPKDAPQPVKESYLLTDELESAYAPYAISKIAGILMCQAYNQQYGSKFINVIAAEVYGSEDNRKLSEVPVRKSEDIFYFVRIFAVGKTFAFFHSFHNFKKGAFSG